MTKKEIKVGDVVSVDVRRYNQIIKITGTVSKIEEPYGVPQYLITNTRTDDFWARTVKLI